MAASDKVATGGSPAFPAPHNRALMHVLLSNGMRKAAARPPLSPGSFL